ncbi:MAG: AraC family transcriptional regulator [Tannerellaceae bacterium]|jgi:AraC-like DNA-binding protein|nr:AraC family transcriptional regulator [Tannerellaceae bacterium]
MTNSLNLTEQTFSSNEPQAGFRYFATDENTQINFQNNNHHHLVFILEGLATANCNEFKEQAVQSKEFIFLPKLSNSFLMTTTPCKVVVFSFTNLKSTNEKQAFQSYWRLFPNVNYSFEPLPFRSPLIEFFDLVLLYLGKNINCTYLHELKHQELFLILHFQYPKEELARFFYPIIGKSFDFRSMVMDNYLKIRHIDELARMSGMGRTNFDNKFKEEFGSSPHQWILKQKGKLIKQCLMEPNMTFSDIMRKFGLNSATHFTRFCKQQFGCTPTELARQMKREALEKTLNGPELNSEEEDI